MKYGLICGFLWYVMMAIPCFASVGSVALDHAAYDLRDKASLQRGLHLYVNYCAGCHSMQYQRYNRVARDLGIPEQIMKENLIFQDVKVGSLMTNAMAIEDAKKWFGAAPPDLTLVARVRGADWLYTYLRSFYVDPARPLGVNNIIFPNVGMPHVLEPLQGTTYPVVKTHEVNGKSVSFVAGIERADNGELTKDEYDQAILDLVNYLVYSAEPIQLERKRLGFWVLGFLFILLVLTYFLKKEFWRDVH